MKVLSQSHGKYFSMLMVVILLIIASIFLSPIFSERVFAQTPDSTQQPINFDITIPGIGTLPVNQQMIQYAGTAIVLATFFFIIAGIILIFLSTLLRFKRIPREKALSFGWNSVKNHLVFFAGIALLQVVFSNLLFIIIRIAANVNLLFIVNIQTNRWYVLASMIIGFFISTYATAGVISIALKYNETATVSFRQFFIPPLRYINFLVANILYILGLFIGTLLFIVPAAWFGSKFFFWPYLILEEGIPFWEAFKRSAVMTHGAKKEIFLFWYLTVAIILLGIVLLGIGYLIAFPITILSSVYVYRAFAHPQNKTIATYKEAK